ncbi:MAG: cation:proton antiporter [Elusimicrobia bacterium]|nr:cation:proton antiporter [Elusimicrobiota bacterium]
MVRQVAHLLAPWIHLGALYVLFHGHTSPGGGFQAGVLLGAGTVLERLVAGSSARGMPDPGRALRLGAVGVFLYVLLGAFGIFWGRAFLDYAGLPLAMEEAFRRYWGILGIEIGICLAVMAVIASIFSSLAWDRSSSS